MNKVLIYIFTFVLILTLGLGGYYWYLSRPRPEPKSTETVKEEVSEAGDEVSEASLQIYKGNFICLSRKAEAEPPTEEEGCIFGFRDEGGQNYALVAKGLAKKFQENAPVQIWGNLDTAVETPYDIVGFINASRVETQ